MKLKLARDHALLSKAWDVLVECAGAQEITREDFIGYLLRRIARAPYGTYEFRFLGALGGGGKFWLTPGTFHVSCYLEDKNAARIEVIQHTNARLAKLFQPPEVEVV
jgi:hypothetical protein